MDLTARGPTVSGRSSTGKGFRTGYPGFDHTFGSPMTKPPNPLAERNERRVYIQRMPPEAVA